MFIVHLFSIDKESILGAKSAISIPTKSFETMSFIRNLQGERVKPEQIPSYHGELHHLGVAHLSLRESNSRDNRYWQKSCTNRSWLTKPVAQSMLLSIHVPLPSYSQDSQALWAGNRVCQGAESFLFLLTLLLELQCWQWSWEGLFLVGCLAGAFPPQAESVALVKSPCIWERLIYYWLGITCACPGLALLNNLGDWWAGVGWTVNL